MKTCATRSGIQSVERAVAVVEWLGLGDFTEWKSIREVAAGTGLPAATCHGLLETLTGKGWVDKKEGKGYRIGALRLIGMLIYMQEYYEGKLKACGGGKN